MNTTTFGFHADNCLQIGKGVIEPAIKAGAKIISLHSIFDKGYDSHASFLKRLNDYVLWNAAGKPQNIILNIAYAPWSMMTPEQKAAIPDQFKAAGEYSNRWPPASMDAYSRHWDGFINELKKYPDLSNRIIFDLGQEPNAPRYWWGTYDEYLAFYELKLYLLFSDNRPIFGHHTSTGLLMNPDASRPEYLPLLSRPNLSTSLYQFTKHGEYKWGISPFPDASTKAEILFAECGKYASIPQGSKIEADFNSPAMMKYYVDFLKWSWNISQQTATKKHTIIWYTLYACNSQSGRGDLAFWLKNPANGTYIKRPAWDHLKAFLSVVKDGWLPTNDGVIGANGKRIIIREDGLSYEMK